MKVGKDIDRDVAPEEEAAEVEHERDGTNHGQNTGPILFLRVLRLRLLGCGITVTPLIIFVLHIFITF